jgi:hypothetical protein
LNRLSFSIDVWHNDDILIGDLPDGLLLFLYFGLSVKIDVVLGKAPAFEFGHNWLSLKIYINLIV